MIYQYQRTARKFESFAMAVAIVVAAFALMAVFAVTLSRNREALGGGDISLFVWLIAFSALTFVVASTTDTPDLRVTKDSLDIFLHWRWHSLPWSSLRAEFFTERIEVQSPKMPADYWLIRIVNRGSFAPKKFQILSSISNYSELVSMMFENTVHPKGGIDGAPSHTAHNPR